MCTSKNAPTPTSLRQNPAVAITIDTEVHPPKIDRYPRKEILSSESSLPSSG